MAGVVGARSGDDRDAVGALRDRELDEPELLLVGERRGLARRPADDEAVGAVGGEVVHQRDERVLVDAQLLVERGDDRGDQGADIAHTFSISGAPGDGGPGARGR